MVRRNIVLPIALAASAALELGGPAPASAQAATRAALIAFVDSAASAAVKSHATAGVSVGIAKGSAILVAKGYGRADLENDVRATDQTVYRIGSITKQFTAAAIMQLVEQGKIALDDDLTKFLPDWLAHGQRITIRNLLNHTSGIKDYTNTSRWPVAMRLDLPHDSVLALIRNEPLDFTPGTEFRYSNTGYYLLGMIIEKVSGQRYADYVQSHEFGPLAMRSTSYCESRPLIEHRARGYAIDSGALVNAAFISMATPFAAGALCSTVGDLMTWTRALGSGRAVSPASYAQMVTPMPLPSGKAQSYGFGLAVGTLSGHRMVTHNGGIEGFRSQMASYPDDSLIIVVLANTETALPGTLEKAIARRALGIADVVPKDLVVSAADRAFVAGRYNTGEVVVEVLAKEGGLFMQFAGGAPARLLYQGNRSFVQADDPDFRLTFVGTGAAADTLVVSVPGQTIRVPRIPAR